MGDLGKLIVAKDFKKWPKSNKSSNLVTLSTSPILQAWACWPTGIPTTRKEVMRWALPWEVLPSGSWSVHPSEASCTSTSESPPPSSSWRSWLFWTDVRTIEWLKACVILTTNRKYSLTSFYCFTGLDSTKQVILIQVKLLNSNWTSRGSAVPTLILPFRSKWVFSSCPIM